MPDDLGAFGLRQALHVAEHGVGFVAVGQVQAEHADAGVLQGFQHWVAAIDGEHARQQAFFSRYSAESAWRSEDLLGGVLAMGIGFAKGRIGGHCRAKAH